MAKSEAHPALLGGHERVVAPDDAGDKRDAAPGGGRDDTLRSVGISAAMFSVFVWLVLICSDC
jgi:hypothetical protein